MGHRRNPVNRSPNAVGNSLRYAREQYKLERSCVTPGHRRTATGWVQYMSCRSLKEVAIRFKRLYELVYISSPVCSLPYIDQSLKLLSLIRWSS
jgi:hypothetical protein